MTVVAVLTVDKVHAAAARPRLCSKAALAHTAHLGTRAPSAASCTAVQGGPSEHICCPSQTLCCNSLTRGPHPINSHSQLGRRPLLLAGVGAMVASLLCLGVSQGALGGGGGAGGASAWVSVVALLLYVGAYQCSFGPISWLIVGEVGGGLGVEWRLRVQGLGAALVHAPGARLPDLAMRVARFVGAAAPCCCSAASQLPQRLPASTPPSAHPPTNPPPHPRAPQVFPLAVRSQAIAVAAVLNYGSNFLVSLALPSVEASIGLPATYLGFAAVGAVALLSIYYTGGRKGGGAACIGMPAACQLWAGCIGMRMLHGSWPRAEHGWPSSTGTLLLISKSLPVSPPQPRQCPRPRARPWRRLRRCGARAAAPRGSRPRRAPATTACRRNGRLVCAG